MPDQRNRYDGKDSEEQGLPPGVVENDPQVHQADPAVATGELSESPRAPLDRPSTEPNQREKRERDEMIDQMEEFEGPSRREIRGDNLEPADDPGVSHS